ncbi:MAG TPA: protein-glutamate O-methyltransferase CheR [Clostridia bacterium]|nr:protein-glutamate O-methyltransferase CheR [Clostridia bacterium]
MLSATIATENYEFIRRLVYEQSRINLGHDKVELVRSRVQKRLRALGLQDFDSYCRLLDSPAGEEELTALLDVISTNVTEFFREWRHFEFLRDVALPAWVKSPTRRPGEPFRVWSAACSSGEEPYSIAILLAEFFRRQSAEEWRITATDISTRMLSTAQQGVYKGERVKLPAPEWLRAYFQKGQGSWEGHFRVKADLRERITFQHLNLVQWPYPLQEKFQVIFCRNVMIYFDRKTQEQLVPKLGEQLLPGGYLMVGHSESLVGIEHGLKCVRPSVYQKT